MAQTVSVGVRLLDITTNNILMAKITFKGYIIDAVKIYEIQVLFGIISDGYNDFQSNTPMV